MGEVYKARDTRLERTVAIKVLPQHLSSSPEVAPAVRARGEDDLAALASAHLRALRRRAARARPSTWSWNTSKARRWRTRLAQGPLPLEQALRYGIEIADALDKAHRQGIVHRDLKPGNVMLTKSGVKLLDFGLAKAMAPPAAQQRLDGPSDAARDLTQEGTILGTFQYMAPEQLEGKDADARTDIFAFGARALRDGDGPEGVLRRDAGLPHLGDHVERAAADLARCSRCRRRRSTAS